MSDITIVYIALCISLVFIFGMLVLSDRKRDK